MKNYTTVLFDLDGTLTDPAEGITNSVKYAIRSMKLKPLSYETLLTFIGPPLVESFCTYCGTTKEEASAAVKSYREYYSVKGIYENRLYDGIPEMLDILKKSGKKIVLATSKPEPYAIDILKHFGIFGYFDEVCGALMDESRTNKWEVISYALESCGIKNKSNVLMVGDRKHDIIGASKNGIDSCGVLFGYGSLQELSDAGADYIVETVEAITKLVIG